MRKPLVVIHSLVCEDGIDEIERPIIESCGAEAVLASSLQEFERLLPELNVMIVANANINREILERAKKCRAVIRHGMGVDNIDLSAATELGIMVCNIPDFNIREVAEHALSFALCLARNIFQYNWAVKTEKRWHHASFPPPHLISETSLGIAGFGKIGRLLAQKARPLFKEVLAYDPFMDRTRAKEIGVRVFDELDDLVRESDILSIHVPLTDKTFHLMDERRIGLMKPTASLINCSRGELVDGAALLRALEGEKIAGAALDVIENEAVPDLEAPFFKERRLCLTPHVAWYSVSSLMTQRTVAAEEARDVIMGRVPIGRVNKVEPREAIGNETAD